MNYDKVVPDTSQYENLKTVGEKIDDIFDHTDEKIVQVMNKLTKVYNSKRSSTLDLTEDEDLQSVLKNNIAFHVKYQHKKHSFGDFVMNRLAGSDKMKPKPKFMGIDSKKLNNDTLLKTCLNPEKLS